MSRSRKKSPYTAIASGGESEKRDKRAANRRLRKSNNQILAAAAGQEDPSDAGDVADGLLHIREVSEVYSFSKDGKKRVDPQKCPKALRK